MRRSVCAFSLRVQCSAAHSSGTSSEQATASSRVMLSSSAGRQQERCVTAPKLGERCSRVLPMTWMGQPTMFWTLSEASWRHRAVGVRFPPIDCFHPHQLIFQPAQLETHCSQKGERSSARGQRQRLEGHVLERHTPVQYTGAVRQRCRRRRYGCVCKQVQALALLVFWHLVAHHENAASPPHDAARVTQLAHRGAHFHVAIQRLQLSARGSPGRRQHK